MALKTKFAKNPANIRSAQIKAKRLEAERIEAEKIEAEKRLEAEKIEAEKRLEAERIEAEKRLEAEKIKAKKIKAADSQKIKIKNPFRIKEDNEEVLQIPKALASVEQSEALEAAAEESEQVILSTRELEELEKEQRLKREADQLEDDFLGFKVYLEQEEGLDYRQKLFVEEFVKCGVVWRAHEKAFGHRGSSAYKLASDPLIVKYVDYYNSLVDRRIVAGLQEVQKFWTKTMRDKNEKTADRIKASELLAKANGAFIERHLIQSKGDLTLNVVLDKELEEYSV